MPFEYIKFEVQPISNLINYSNIKILNNIKEKIIKQQTKLFYSESLHIRYINFDANPAINIIDDLLIKYNNKFYNSLHRNIIYNFINLKLKNNKNCLNLIKLYLKY